MSIYAFNNDYYYVKDVFYFDQRNKDIELFHWIWRIQIMVNPLQRQNLPFHLLESCEKSLKNLPISVERFLE